MKETKEMIDFAMACITAMDKSLEDGRLSLSDILNFYNVLPKVASAVEGVEKIPNELNNLTNEQLEELNEYVKEKFDLRNDNVELLVEHVLNLIISLIISINEIRKVKKVE